MKKFIISLLVLFIGVNCTKEVVLCGCSPVHYSFLLILKNQQNADLLDPATPGAYDKSAIKIRFKQGSALKDAGASVLSPFNVTSTQKTDYHFINSNMAELNVSGAIKEFYIDFGNSDTDTITLDSYDKVTFEPVNLRVNNKPLVKESTLSQAGSFYALIK